jgi:hypothetical protein
MIMHNNASRGGHASGHLRDAFYEWVFTDNDSVPTLGDDVTELVNPHDGGKWTLERLLGQLWNCTDVMTNDLCGAIDLPGGSTYAQGVREMKYYLQHRRVIHPAAPALSVCR